ncbi:TetR/AcrR family transcriptional regulator [Williamsia sp. MIQD14]|uniref:TetR/AcrR family transcriptional regulator n=1 Tax=Williamsia sp. MIQD14 TaxID=3425703 RepID=UPI003DA0FB93
MREGSETDASGVRVPRIQLRIRERHLDFIEQFLAYVADHGAAHATLANLAERSDYSKATWYNHFASVDELWSAVACINSAMQLSYFGACAEVELSADARKILILSAYLQHSISNPVIWKLATIHRMREAQPSEAKDAALLALEGQVRATVVGFMRQGTGSRLPEATVIRRTDIARALVSGFGNFAALGREFRWSEAARGEDMLHAIAVQLADLGLVENLECDTEAIWDHATAIVAATTSQWRSVALDALPGSDHPLRRSDAG